MKKVGIFLLLNFVLISCKSVNTTNNSSTVKANLNHKPKREAYAGFVWEKVSGTGIEFWAQRSKEISVGISETLPGAFIEKHRMVFQGFEAMGKTRWYPIHKLIIFGKLNGSPFSIGRRIFSQIHRHI